ncbi:MAG: hypothetical protein HOM11_14905 [Methylococcales bacterium]|jgi:hypothetical protein|nr:hypothetical protein [Methylococcales bacterium]MBT6053104.1 hypothetical protein [Candidatus Scalindua sp.]
MNQLTRISIGFAFTSLLSGCCVFPGSCPPPDVYVIKPAKETIHHTTVEHHHTTEKILDDAEEEEQKPKSKPKYEKVDDFRGGGKAINENDW